MKLVVFLFISLFFHLSVAVASDDYIDLRGKQVKKGSVEHLKFVEDAYYVQVGLCLSKPNVAVCRGARLFALRDESSSRRLVNDLLQKLRKACTEGSKLHCEEQTTLENVFGIKPTDQEIRD